MTGIRKSFDEQLRELQEDVVRMGGLAAEAVRIAIQELVEHNPQLHARVLEIENRIDALNLAIEQKSLQLLALQQPMARDLRTIASVMRITADIERIGDYAMDTAGQAKALADQPLFKPLIDIPRMAETVQRMLHDSMRAFVSRDLELALAAVKLDDEVDHAYRSLHEELTEFIRRDPTLVYQAIRLLMIGVYLERMADHITNIGERIFYIETGELKELHE